MASRPIVALLGDASPTISVGVLTADLLALGSEIRTLEQSAVRLLHFDVMDGCFTPMMTIGPPLIKAVRTRLLKDVHLMVEEPLAKVAEYAAAGADVITVHVESCRYPHRVLQQVGGLVNANDPARGIARGIALNPGTPLEAVEPLLDEADLVVLLAINPGWGGQKFLPGTIERVARLRGMIAERGRDVLVGLDGGITRQNVSEIAKAGADLVVTGSAVFDGGDVVANAAHMLAALRREPAGPVA